MSKPWRVLELKEQDIEEYGADSLPGLPYAFHEEDNTNFVVEHEDYGFIGRADLFEGDNHYTLMNCEIRPQRRGMDYEGKSVFEDLIETRLEKAGDDKPIKTDAVTEHGMTQYKISQYGFEPLQIGPSPNPHNPPMIEMWRGDFNQAILNLPEEYIERIERTTEDFLDTRIGGGTRTGLDYQKFVPFEELEESLQVYSIHRGEKDVEKVIDEIIEDNRNSRNYAINVLSNTRFPETEDLAQGLSDEGFDLFGLTPPTGENAAKANFGKFNRDIYNVKATEETMMLMENLGIDLNVEDTEEKSSEITILS